MIDIVLQILLIVNGQAGVHVPKPVDMGQEQDSLPKSPNMEELIAKAIIWKNVMIKIAQVLIIIL